MKFDIVVGNPPYGVRKQGNARLHFDIMDTAYQCLNNGGILNFIMPAKCVYDTGMDYERNLLKNCGCEDIQVFKNTNELFGTDMSVNVGIFRFVKGSKKYDKKLDDSFIDSVYSDIEKKYMKFMDTGKTMFEYFSTTPRNKERTEERLQEFVDSLNKEFYFNINFYSGQFNKKIFTPGCWISGKLVKKGILTQEEEKEFTIKDKSSRRVFGFNESKRLYAENLFAALQRPLLRFGLWLIQDDQSMNTKVYKYFPDIDYSKVNTDEDILIQVGCEDPDERKEILDYVNNFDFSEKRNDRFLKSETPVDPEDSSPSSSESSKTVLDN